MRQVGRTLTMADAETCRVLICDRDAKWSEPVHEILQEAGIRIVQTPYRAPNANAYAERFVRSIKEECLNRIIPLGQRHFRKAVHEYVAHYHLERNHQGYGSMSVTRACSPKALSTAYSNRPWSPGSGSPHSASAIRA
ncbi:MAG: hypothetical protein DMG04_10610 [Acidobacteria bacterium]|nr:MAG: hypothetical protein DMG04_10610 [Acidobacteriota bacterium]